MISTQNIINLALLGSIIVLGMLAFSPEAEADPYIGTSVFTMDTSVGDFRGVDLNVGFRAGDILEFRASYMIGAEDETYQGVAVELDKKYGLDVIVNLPLSDSLNPYLSVGNTWLEAKASAGGYSASAKDDFITYGAGMRFDIRESVSVYGEYKDIDGADVFSVGLLANF
jgi:opacity protein-like surface antigen